MKDKKVAKVKKKFEGEWTIYANYTVAPKGRIWVLWKDHLVEVQVVMASYWMVHCIVKDRGSDFSCELTFFYSYNTIAERKEMWNQLRSLHNNIKDPWLVMEISTQFYQSMIE